MASQAYINRITQFAIKRRKLFRENSFTVALTEYSVYDRMVFRKSIMEITLGASSQLQNTAAMKYREIRIQRKQMLSPYYMIQAKSPPSNGFPNPHCHPPCPRHNIYPSYSCFTV